MRFIFVGGSGRSGTTLVQKLLASHSRIMGGPEFDHTGEISLLYQRMASESYLTRQSFFCDAQELAEIFRDFYESFFRKTCHNKDGAIYYSEKTPANIQVADILLGLFPDALFVNVIRDGRDVLLSNLKVRERYGATVAGNPGWRLLTLINSWNSAIDKYLLIQANERLARRFLTVKFEDLVSCPAKELSRLFSFLSLDVESQLFHPEQITSKDTNAIIDNIWYPEQMYNQGYNAAQVGKWQEGLSFVQRLVGNVLMAERLQVLGYEINPFYVKMGKGLTRLKNL